MDPIPTHRLLIYIPVSILPVARIAEHFGVLYNMPISQGTVCNMLERFASKAIPAYELIKTKVMGVDKTKMKINGDKNWF